MGNKVLTKKISVSNKQSIEGIVRITLNSKSNRVAVSSATDPKIQHSHLVEFLVDDRVWDTIAINDIASLEQREGHFHNYLTELSKKEVAPTFEELLLLRGYTAPLFQGKLDSKENNK